MDFHALYGLWWEAGSGREAHGLPTAQTSNDKHRRAVDDAFEACSFYLADAMCAQLAEVVFEEAGNACDEHLIPPDVFAQWLKYEADESTREFFRALRKPDGNFAEPEKRHPFWNCVGFFGADKLFRAPFWKTYADQYGGEKWAVINEAFRALFHAVKHDLPLKEVAYRLDDIYGLPHNTGMLVNKPKMEALRVSAETLDALAQMKSPQDFLPYVSSEVKKLIIACGRTEESWTINPWQRIRDIMLMQEVAEANRCK